MERSEVMEGGGIAHEKAAARAGVGASFVDESGGGVDAGGADAFGGDGASEDSLTAADVKMDLVAHRLEEVERAGDDHLAIEVGAFFADEPVIPGSGLVPGGVSGGLLAGTGGRSGSRGPGSGALAAWGRHEREAFAVFLLVLAGDVERDEPNGWRRAVNCSRISKMEAQDAAPMLTEEGGKRVKLKLALEVGGRQITNCGGGNERIDLH